MNFKKFDTYIFDLDGTLWNFPNLFNGTDKIFEKLKKMNKNIIIVSNFTYLDRDDIIKILKNGGIEIEKEKLITSSYVAAMILKNKKVYPIGKGLKKELEKNGVKISSNDVDAVVVGHDTEFNYWKASKVLNLLEKGSDLYTTATGKIWNFKNKRVPGTGLIIAGLEYCSNKKAIMVGKPSKYISKFVKKLIIGKAVHFGDEIKADSEFAKSINAEFVFVRSGVDKMKKKVKAYAILNSIKDMKKFL
ncbi:MAG: HAD hydrolase-like protein [Candidatus Aenigmatarchaeota archaeon]